MTAVRHPEQSGGGTTAPPAGAHVVTAVRHPARSGGGTTALPAGAQAVTAVRHPARPRPELPDARRSAASRWAPAVAVGVLIAVAALPALPATAQEGPLEQESWARPPEVIERAVLAPRHRNVTLSDASPDGRYFLREESAGLPGMAAFARPHLWLGGLQVDPAANRVRTFSTRGAAGLSVLDVETGRWTELEVPAGATVSGAKWSPDGGRVAYFANFDDATHVWVAELPGGRARRVTGTPVLATLTTTLEWTSDGRGIVTVLLPAERGGPLAVPAVPTGPQVRHTSEGENRLRTFFSLLEWPHEMALLEYYATGQLAIVDVATGAERPVGRPAMIRSVEPGPGGEYLRVSVMRRPFSYIVPVSSFGGADELWSADGRVLATLAERPLNDGVRQAGAGDGGDWPRPQQDTTGMRSIAWRPDGAGLGFLELAPMAGDSGSAAASASAGSPRSRAREPGSGRRDAGDVPAAGNASAERAPRRRDRVMLWAPPFDSASLHVVYENDARMTAVRYSADGRVLFITEVSSGGQHTFAVFLDDPSTKHTIARGRSDARSLNDADFYADPGSLLTVRGALGYDAVRMTPDGGSVFLGGTQHFRDPEQEAPRPFIDRVALRTGDRERVFEGENRDVSERIVAVLDDDARRVVVMRESPTQVPDAWLRERDAAARRLTTNRDPTPAITRAQRRRFTVQRPDGVAFRVDVTLPPDHTPGTRLPAMFWFYPREFADQESYDRTLRTHNRNRFPATGPRSIEYLVLLGYAVVQPDAPIIGPQGRMNDNYVHDLRNNLAAVIDHLDAEGIIDRRRLGVGGHSYGAFSTVNAMVHTPFFRAGIAGDGAYNRTLTPLGFQSERRDLWQARETYLGMSPFLHANNLTGALLLYHGIDDQNVGTHPINSVRLFHALNGLGKTAALYMYPYEDHGPATQETLLDLWARWVAWLDRHVRLTDVGVPVTE